MYLYRDVIYTQIVRVADQSTAAQFLKPGTLVLVMPGEKPKWLKFICPCGCGEVVSVNLMPGQSRAWRITLEPKRGLSLWPSVHLQAGCKSHFTLFNNTARLLYRKHPQADEGGAETNDRGGWIA
jgi:hypothetical protein